MNELQLCSMLFGVVCIIGLTFSSQLYDFDLWLYRKLGWAKLADKWEQRKSWWLPISRSILGILATIAIVTLYLSKR